jgi:hypothetical protein
VKSDTTVYPLAGFDASTRWAIVSNALREAGVTNVRRPASSLSRRPAVSETLVSSVEV